MHCVLYGDADGISIQDLSSTNGTYVNGKRIFCVTKISNGDVVRIGESLFIYHDDLSDVRPTIYTAPFLGQFWAPKIAMDTRLAARAGHVLVTGQSGVGKELAAKIAADEIMSASKGHASRFQATNAAEFGTEDEAITTLFGVKAGTYTGVSGRKGLLELYNGGALFIDEAHRYPPRIQAALLRGIETGEYRRPGDHSTFKSSVRLILATNAPGKSCGLIEDLYNRLHSVHIPTLNRRRADAPEIFQGVLKSLVGGLFGQVAPQPSMRQAVHEAIRKCLYPEHMEAICLADYDGVNTRKLTSLAMHILAQINKGGMVQDAVDNAFFDVFGDMFERLCNRDDCSGDREAGKSMKNCRRGKYEKQKALISELYRTHGTVAKTAREMEKAGHPVSQRWVSEYLKQWGLRGDG